MGMLKIGSCFTGAGGMDLGFEQADLGPVVWQIEINAACRRVLKRHWPGVDLHEDIRTCGKHNLAPVDIICGGWPCQDLSVAGKRAGITGGDRSILFFEMKRIVNELKPTLVAWENVPGLGSSFCPVEPTPDAVEGGVWDVEEDSDFETVLRELQDIGYFGAARILDAQYFGLAQRRERWIGVFARGDIGAERCAEILSLAEGMCWHPAPSREKGQGIAGTLESRTGGGGFPGTDEACDGYVIPDVAWALQERDGKGPDSDTKQGHLIPVVAPPLTRNPWGDNESREGLLVAHTLRREGFDGSEDGTGRGAPIVPVAYRTSGNCGAFEQGDKTAALNTGTDASQNIVCYENHAQDSRIRDCGELSPTINGKAGTGGNNLPLVMAFTQNASGEVRTGECTNTLNTNSNASGRNTGMVFSGLSVRRLTPRECERLQGFQWRCDPDFPGAWRDELGRWWSPDWTAGESDSARYKMMGNSVAVPVFRWIGERIVKQRFEGQGD